MALWLLHAKAPSEILMTVINLQRCVNLEQFDWTSAQWRIDRITQKW